jgi:hypothetical protein
MKKIIKYGIFLIGGFSLLLLLTPLAKTAVSVLSGLAVAQSSTNWKPLKDGAFGDNVTNGVGVFSPYVFDGTNFDRARGDITNGLDVDVTRVSGSVTMIGDNTPADDYTNPTDAIDTNTLNSELGGTTWDRIRHSWGQSTTGVTTNAAGTTVDMTATAVSKYTMIIDRTVGATNVVEIDLQCSINNTAFVQIATITDLTNEPALVSTDGVPCFYMRYNVVTVGTGNTLAIDLLAMR